MSKAKNLFLQTVYWFLYDNKILHTKKSRWEIKLSDIFICFNNCKTDLVPGQIYYLYVSKK
jgi:hypothetical protein